MIGAEDWIGSSTVDQIFSVGGLDGLESRDGHYGLSDSVVRNAGIAANVAASFSMVSVIIFLASSLWVYSYQKCRHLLDRVSFRLLVVAMSWEFWYSFNFLLLYINDTIYKPGRSWGPKHCTAGAYFMISAMHVVDLLVMFIALNLFLTINLGINPVRLRLERWYIGISIILGYMIPLPSAIKERFGWDFAMGTCWINGTGRKTRVKYLLEGVYVTPLITCTVSTICVAAVLIVLFRQGRATSRALFGGKGGKQKIQNDNEGQNNDHDEDDDEIGLGSLSFSEDPLSTGSGTNTNSGSGSGLGPLSSINFNSNTNTNSELGSPDTLYSKSSKYPTITKDCGKEKKATKNNEKNHLFKIRRFLKRSSNFFRGKGFLTTEEINSRKHTPQSFFNSLADKFLSIAIKISWYPITLLIINSVMLVGDLVIAAQGGARNHRTVWLYIVYYFFYGGRGIFICGLAFLIDPSLIRGIKAAWKEKKLRKTPDALPTAQTSPPDISLSPTNGRMTFHSAAFEPSVTLNQTIDYTSQSQNQTPTGSFLGIGSGSSAAPGQPFPRRQRIDSDASFDFAAALAYMPDPGNAISPGAREQSYSLPLNDTPTVELNSSYLDQDLDTSVLSDDREEKPIETNHTNLNIQIPTSPPRSVLRQSSETNTSSSGITLAGGSGGRPNTVKKASLLLGRLPAPSYRPLNGGVNKSSNRQQQDVRLIDPEVQRRKEEKRKRDERVKEIKKRFEEVQKQL
ncbi:uncharacterized protein L201_006920 [Kwoniella dendrophila CBS 6074]|uniref:G-protein coupled receptors family 2 profile 2 domain-containing protein n=1 Tax=Kwoniella dendrophila CBS 6074 TaxID=1295534 RepID=A0AAX4K302_9TREE